MAMALEPRSLLALGCSWWVTPAQATGSWWALDLEWGLALGCSWLVTVAQEWGNLLALGRGCPWAMDRF